MKKKVINVAFIINTYNRPKSLCALVQSIRKTGKDPHIYIVDDGSDHPLTMFKGFPNIFLYRQEHEGKKMYWKTCNNLFGLVKDKPYDYYFMLPDDVVIDEDFVEKSIDKWYEIADHKMIALNLITDRIDMACWTNILPEDLGYAYKTGWVDMCMMFDKRFFGCIGEIPQIVRNWTKNPMAGSGVGAYVSRAILAKGGTMYQVKESFVRFQEAHKESRMNAPVVHNTKTLLPEIAKIIRKNMQSALTDRISPDQMQIRAEAAAHEVYSIAITILNSNA